MSVKSFLQTVIPLTLAVASCLFIVTCSESPTSPALADEQGEGINTAGEREMIPGKIRAVAGSRGTLPGGSLYEILVPDPWNGDVVVYAHGYVRPDEPLALPDDEINGIPVSGIINNLGYAYVSTSYRRNGLVVPEAVMDLMELVELFRQEYPSTGHVLLVGVSEGGLITTLALEKHPDVFDGGLAACGPIGDFHRQLNYIGDFRIVFDYFFPDLIPGSPVAIPDQVINDWETIIKPQVISAIYNYPHRTRQLLRVTRAPIDQNDPASIENTVIGILEYNIFGTNDAISQLGGQPVDNKRKIYLGSYNDFRLNLRIQRFSADLAAVNEIENNYQTSGRLDVPLSAIHTIGDEIVPYWHEPLYRLKIFSHKAGFYHSNLPVFRYGHCNFNQAEVLAAFAVLVLKVTATDLLVAENVVPTVRMQTQLRSIAGELGANPKIIPVDR